MADAKVALITRRIAAERGGSVVINHRAAAGRSR
jgi:hypothetical protein